MDAPEQMQGVRVSETTWLEDIVEFQGRDMPDGTRILTYILSNGHRYVIPLRGQTLSLTQRAISPVIVAGSDAIQNGHHGA